MNWESNNALYHHGIEGQKWGIRRWQYEDGSLTPEGVKRYRKSEKYKDKQISKIEKRIAKDESMYGKSISRLEDKVAKKDTEKNRKRLEDEKAMLAYRKAVGKAEIEKVKSYTPDDVSAEQKYVSKKIINEYSKTALWSMVGFYRYSNFDVNDVKTQYRLSHSGIQKQRWGFRRFQNPDGSLTPAGRERYRKMRQAREGKTEEKPEAPKTKKVTEMTDDELREKINRINLEKSYYEAEKNRLSNMAEVKKYTPDTRTAGQKFFASIRDEVVLPAAKESGKEMLKSYMKSYGIKTVNEALGMTDDKKKDKKDDKK